MLKDSPKNTHISFHLFVTILCSNPLLFKLCHSLFTSPLTQILHTYTHTHIYTHTHTHTLSHTHTPTHSQTHILLV